MAVDIKHMEMKMKPGNDCMRVERDALGEKPLYYYRRADGSVLVDTTVAGLLEQGVPRRMSAEGFWSFMLCGAVQEPYTMIEGVRSLPPGSELDALGGCTGCWRPDHRPGDWTYDTARAAVTAAIEDAVARALADSDAANPPSIFLSGGIDSSAVVSVMRRVLGRDAVIRSYCLVHEDRSVDEREWARKAAERNGTEHTEFLLTGATVRDNVVAALDAYDQPSIDGLNNYFASKFVAEAGVRTVLSGEGGDELFGGYGQYAKPRLAYRVAARLGVLRGCAPLRGVGALVTRFAREERWKKFGQLLATRYDPYFLTRRQFDAAWVGRMVRPEHARLAAPPDLDELFDSIQREMGTDVDFGDDVVNRCAWMEVRHNLLSMFVRDAVQTSAPFGLDIRSPLMDRGLVELMCTIPGPLKCHPELSKPLLVAAAGDGIPPECARRRKQGFALPFDRYLREGLGDEFDGFVDGDGCGLFRPDAIAKVWSDYRSGRTSWRRVWQPFVLDRWCRRFRVEF